MKKENKSVNEKQSVKSILNTLNEKTNGLLKTSLGKKTEIYNEELFAELDDKKKKSYRKKLRNTTFSLLHSILESKEKKDEKKMNTLISAFIEFYQSAYKVNDFTIASIASENMKDTKKDLLIKGLEIVKENNK